MKHIIFCIIFTMLGLQIPSFAQVTVEQQQQPQSQQQKKESADTKTNQGFWYIGAEAGSQIFFSKNDRKMAFGDRLAPSLDICFGRQFTKVFGMDITFSNAVFKGVASPLTKEARFSTGVGYFGSNPDEKLILQNGSFMDLYLRFLADLTKWWGGENNESHSSAIVYAGGGLMKGYGKSSAAMSPSINAGLIYRYSFNNGLAVNATLRGALVNSGFEAENCSEHTFHGLVGLNVGVTYSFR